MFRLKGASLLLLVASSNAFSVVPPPATEIVVPSSSHNLVDLSTTTFSQRELHAKSAAIGSSSVSLSAAATTTTATTTATSTATPAIVIADINYDGKVPTTESDEYIVITNTSKNPVDVSGYYMYVFTSGTQGPTFTFPKDSVIKPGASVRVYTNEIHKESGGYSYGSGKAIWNNRGGLAVLRDSKGGKVGEFKYKAPTASSS